MKRTGGTALKDRFGSAVLELSPIPQHAKGLVLEAPVVHTQQNVRELPVVECGPHLFR